MKAFGLASSSKKKDKENANNKKADKKAVHQGQTSGHSLTVAAPSKASTAFELLLKAPRFFPTAISNNIKVGTQKLKRAAKGNKHGKDNLPPFPSASFYSPESSQAQPPLRDESQSASSSKEKGTISQRRPSETPRVNDLIVPGNSHNNSRKSSENARAGVPAIRLEHVGDSVKAAPFIARSNSITNIAATKDGFLNRKIESGTKASSLSRGWRVYRVILRGYKLYFYKPPSEAVLKTFFENNKDLTGNDLTFISPEMEHDCGMTLQAANFESEACYEVDRSAAMHFKKHVCLLIFEDSVVICKRKWVRYTSVKVLDAMGVFKSGNSSSTNLVSSNVDGKDWDTRSISSVRVATETDASGSNKSKGYFSKWKLDACYPIHCIDVVPDPNFPSGFSSFITPSSQQNYFVPSRPNDDASSIRSGSSAVSTVQNNSSTGVLLYLSIEDGDQQTCRVFVPSSAEVKAAWTNKLFAAKEASLRKEMKARSSRGDSANKLRLNMTDANLRQVRRAGDSTDKSIGGSDGTGVKKTRAYWSRDKHPGLIVKQIQVEEAIQEDENTVSADVVFKTESIHDISAAESNESTEPKHATEETHEVRQSGTIETADAISSVGTVINETIEESIRAETQTEEEQQVSEQDDSIQPIKTSEIIPEDNVVQEDNVALEDNVTPEESAALEDNVTPEESAALDDNVAPEENTALEDNGTPEGIAALDDNVAPEENAALEDNVAPEENAALGENAAPEENAALDENAAPEENAASEENAAPEDNVALEDNVAPEDNKTPDDEAEDPSVAKAETETSEKLEVSIAVVEPQPADKFSRTFATPVVSQRHISGGSLDSLIHELVFQTQRNVNDNDDLLRTFLLTYTLFSDASYVFRELRRCASDIVQKYADEDNGDVFKKSILSRLITIFKTWCNICGDDLTREEVHKEMTDVVADLLIDKHEDAEELSKLIENTRANAFEINRSGDHEEIPLQITSQPSLDFSNLNVTGLTPALFLKMSPDELAQQLYIFHFLELRRNDPGMNLKNFIPSKYPRPSYLQSSLNFTTSAPHFVTRLIFHHILIVSQQSGYTSRRPALISHWIKIGQACKLLGDMTGWMAVASGICSPGIIRLKETWERVDEHCKNLVVNEWSSLLSEYGGPDGECDVDDIRSLLLIAQDKKEKSKSRPIPYFGFITIALERINSSVPGFIDNVGRGGRNAESGIVNFDKYWKMYDVVTKSLEAWNIYKDTDESVSVSCPFALIQPLQRYFKHLNSIQVTVNTWQVFESSIQCEPTLHGQYLEYQANERKVHHSAYVPLLFVEVIPSNRLFDRKAFLSASGNIGRKSSSSSMNSVSENSFSSNLQTGRSMNGSAGDKASAMQSSLLVPGPHTRRRTLSFPQEKISQLTSTTWNTSLDLVTRSWLGNFVQNRSGDSDLLKSMKDLAGVDEMLIFVKDGDLVFKSVEDTASVSRPASIVESPPQSNAGALSKRNSVQGALYSPHVNAFSEYEAHLVVVKAGTLERLLDVLVNGVAAYSTSVVDDNGEPPLATGRQGQLSIDSEEYTATFFATYRSFCKPDDLLEDLRRRFVNAKKSARIEPESQSSDVREIDWKAVAKIQLNVLKLLEYWIQEFFNDFLDSLDTRSKMMNCIDEFISEAEDWGRAAADENLISLSKRVVESSKDLRMKATRKCLEPIWNAQHDRLIAAVDAVITDSQTHGRVSSDGNIQKDDVQILSINSTNAVDLIESIDLTVLGLFQTVTRLDWLLTYELLEMQSSDVLSWYPKKHASYLQEEDIIITDIFTMFEDTASSTDSDKRIVGLLPRSIQSLCRLHAFIRNWVILEITSTKLDIQARSKKIDLFLDMILLSRRRMVRLEIYPKNDTAKQDDDTRRSVPSFVESAIVSGLISPESRQFTRAWLDVAINRNGTFETLEALLYGLSPKPAEQNSSEEEIPLVPCVGWLFERMLEICCNIPNMSFDSDRLVNFDKRRYTHNLIQIYIQSQRELVVNIHKREAKMDVQYLTSKTVTSGIGKFELRHIKDLAAKENVALRIANLPQWTVKSPKPFCKLVAEQQEKIRRDIKERERLAKEIRENQHRIAKHYNEDTRKKDRHFKDTYVMKPVNSLLKAVRPLSLAISNTLYPSSHNIKQSYNSHQRKSNPKAALVINLIDCQTSVDYGIAQKDFVFRLVTEDGAQYVLQAINQEEMNDWMHVIGEASNQALKKRMTIPLEPPVDDDKLTYAEPKTRNSVYGKDLATLMKNGSMPLIVEKCFTEIEKRGLEEIGIYRVPGAALSVENLRSAFNTNAETVDVSVEKYGDINVVAGALKSFFRSLPEPLMSYELYDDFINATGISDYDERHLAIKALLQRLPECNYILLKRLIEHLERVTDYSEINHMYANNLAIVFGPTLLKAPPGPSSFAQSMGNLGKQTTIVKDLILQYHWFFDAEDDTSEVELSELIADHDGVENDELESNHDTSSYVEVDSASADGSLFANTRESEEGDILGEDHESWDYGKKMENYQDNRLNDGSISKFGSFKMRIEHIGDDRDKNDDSMDDQQTDQLIAGSVANRGSVLTDVTEEQEDDFEMVE